MTGTDLEVSPVRLPLPGPSDVLSAARDLTAAAGVLGRAAGAALVLLPQIERAVVDAGGLLGGLSDRLGRVDGLLDRADRAITRLEVTAADADVLLARVDPVVDRVDSAVGRIDPVITRAEHTVGRIDPVITRAEHTVGRIDPVITRAEETVSRIDPVITRAEETVTRIDPVVTGAQARLDQVGTVVTGAQAQVDAAGGVLGTAEALLAQVAPLTERLLPIAQRITDSLSPQEVDAAITLLDRLPTLLDTVDDEVLPLLRTLKDVAPDLHEMLGLLDDVHDVVAGLPGVKRLRRRAQREESTE
ncbi:MAG: ribulose bisphosphate carboxylase large chain [Frankiales bacterium]|nr:ribulose bisphosphate carboxylase large chain [Frankiales bacterium]